MTDIVERLRSVPIGMEVLAFNGDNHNFGDNAHEAADEIERLRKEIRSLSKINDKLLTEKREWLNSKKHDIK